MQTEGGGGGGGPQGVCRGGDESLALLSNLDRVCDNGGVFVRLKGQGLVVEDSVWGC